MTKAERALFDALVQRAPRQPMTWPAEAAGAAEVAWLREGVALWHALRRGAPLDASAAAARLGALVRSAKLTPEQLLAQAGALASLDAEVGSLCALLGVLLSTRAAVPEGLEEAAGRAAAALVGRALDEAGPGEGAALAVRLARLWEGLAEGEAARRAWREAVERDPLVAWALPGEAVVQELAHTATTTSTGAERRLRRAIEASVREDRTEAGALLEGLVAAPRPRAEARFLLALERVRTAAAARPRSPEAAAALSEARTLLDGLAGHNPAVGLLRGLAAIVALDREAAATLLEAELAALTGAPADPGTAAELVAALTELVRRPPHDVAAILRAAYFEGLLDPALAIDVPRGPLASFRKLVIGLSLASVLGSSGTALAMMTPLPAKGSAGPGVAVERYAVADKEAGSPYQQWLVSPVTAPGAQDLEAALSPEAAPEAAQAPDAAEQAALPGAVEDQAAEDDGETRVAVRFVSGHGERADRRQIPEGYWLSQMITPADVPGLQADGVRVVLSAVRPAPETIEALEAAGIESIDVRMGARFRHADVIRDVATRYAPNEILVHCTHGADRTGTIAAFLLVEQFGWSVPDAFYALVYPSEGQVEGMAYALQRMGYDDVRTLEDPEVGVYSPGGRDFGGGLKAHNENFRQIIYTAIEALRGGGT